MLIGKSELVLSTETVCAAVQAYLETTFADGKCPRVMGIEPVRNADGTIPKYRSGERPECFVVSLAGEVRRAPAAVPPTPESNDKAA